MQYGICPLSIVPLRAEPKNTSEQTSQLLYGEFFIILDLHKSWSKIQNESMDMRGGSTISTFSLLKKASFKNSKLPKRGKQQSWLTLFEGMISSFQHRLEVW